MTSLSAYLRAEMVDLSEPASFYVPGAKNWSETRYKRKLEVVIDGTDFYLEPVIQDDD